MQAQTLAFALLAALYPVGLLAVAFLLATDRPMFLGLSLLAGALTSLFVVGLLVLTVLESANLGDSNSSSARGGVRIGFGAAMILAAWLISHRSAPTGPKKEPSWKSRLNAASPVAVFLTGAILYSPSGSYLAAVQQIATSKSGLPSSVQLLIVIAIVLLTVGHRCVGSGHDREVEERLVVREAGEPGAQRRSVTVHAAGEGHRALMCQIETVARPSVTHRHR